MGEKDFTNLMSISAIQEKIFKIKERYNPNLIANLSKEMNDLYLIRKSICDQLLELSSKKDADIGKIKKFIKNKIEENKEKLKKETDESKTKLIKLNIEEWEEFL